MAMFEVVEVKREPESASNRLGRRALGWLLAVLGVGMLVLFVRALIAEVTGGTFYGACICILVLVFALLVTRDGFALAIDRRVQLKPSDDQQD